MEPFSPHFLAQLEQIQKEAERQSLLIQQIIPPETIKMLNKVAEDAYKATAPLRAVLENPSFQQQMKTMQELSEKLSEIYARPRITITDFETFNTLEEVASEVAVEVTKKPEEIQIATRQIVSSTKTEVKKGRQITPLSLPASIHWEDVRVTFVDSETVFIEFPAIDQKITVDYTDMGMWDGRNNKPNAQWFVWRTLAESHGRIDWGSPQASDNLKKQKQLLSQALSKYFNIKGDPFQVYREVKAYELKMTMVPPPTSSSHSIYDDDIQEEYERMTPHMHERHRGLLD